MKNINTSWKMFGKGFRALISITAVLILVIFSLSVFDTPFRIKFFTVLSGSMNPTIPVGSVVAAIPSSDYQMQDIVTYKNEADGATTTHRIIDLQNKDGQVVYLTRGDANESADLAVLEKKNILGKVAFALPYLGFLLVFLKTTKGLVFLVVVPGTIIFHNEYLHLKEILAAELSKNRDRRENRWHRLSMAQFSFILAFLLGAACVVSLRGINSTQANLADTVRLEANLAADPNPLPPSMTLTLAQDKKSAEFAAINLYPYVKLTYVFTYTSDGQNWGTLGTYTLAHQYQSGRTFQLATCSEMGCVPNNNPTNLHLIVTLEDENGAKTVLEESL